VNNFGPRSIAMSVLRFGSDFSSLQSVSPHLVLCHEN